MNVSIVPVRVNLPGVLVQSTRVRLIGQVAGFVLQDCQNWLTPDQPNSYHKRILWIKGFQLVLAHPNRDPDQIQVVRPRKQLVSFARPRRY